MRYRQLALTDHAALMALWRGCAGISLRDADSSQNLRKYLLRNPGLSFVAVDEDAIVGSLMAGHDGRRGYIQHLAVAESHRRRGIAVRLLELCIDALAGEGILKSHVHVVQDNRDGIEFWKRRGWVHRAEIEMYSFVNGDNPDV
jgi:ribosomal protein S18 acetylase RimI-like enzyme